MKLNKLINDKKKKFNFFYKKFLISTLLKDNLSKAMIYGSMNGGKRIRPFLVSFFSEFTNISNIQSFRLSAAIECLHSYSLIHDDLPSMDNDDYRRGKLSTHKKFNESTAILAGDALHDLAFEIISDKKTHPKPELRIKLINILSKSTGFKGLAGGQSLDLLYENKKINIYKILKMYKMKTSSLFSFSCMAPFILSEKENLEINFAKKYGNLFGLIFQITDDILDEEQNFKLLGKTPGKDKKQGKSTLLLNKNSKDLKLLCTNKIIIFINKNKIFFQKNPLLEKILYFNINRLN